MADAVRVVTQKTEIRVIENGKTIKLPAPTSVVRVVDQGPQGIQGQAGIGGYSQRIDQATASANWILNHGKGSVPIVQVFLSSGEVIITDVVATATQINVVFAAPIAGFVVIS
jgi:hypothetical protein